MVRLLSLDKQIYPRALGSSPELDQYFQSFWMDFYRKEKLDIMWQCLPAQVKAKLQGLPLRALLFTPLPAPPPAPLELPLLPTPPALLPAPKQTPAYPPAPSVEALEEVECIQVYKPLQNIRKRPIRQKYRAAKSLPKTMQKTPRDAEVFEVFGNIIVQPPKFSGTNIRLSRDEHLNAWYTTMLNTHANELATRALPNRAQRHAARRHHFHFFRFLRFRALKILRCLQLFRLFDFLTFLLTMDLTLPFYHLIFIGHCSSPAMPHPIHWSYCS